MVKYFLSNKATEDLSKIWSYTFEVWSEKQADKYFEQVIDAGQFIAENPHSGKKYSDVSNEILGYKTYKHIIFYRVNRDTSIEVVRILHQRMDLKNKM